MRNEIKQQRLVEKLNLELGPELLSYLSDPNVIEIMLNPDGKVWLDIKNQGMIPSKTAIDFATAHQLLGSIAEITGTCINETNPRIETRLPFTSYRFAGIIPPNVKAPSFTIRKQCDQIFTLADYIEQGGISCKSVGLLRRLIKNKKTVLIAGGPGTGKTTFANAILREMFEQGFYSQRFILIEDTQELQCQAPNTVNFRTSDILSYDDLLATSLRFRPDVICVGECRGKEMLTLLKAWNTGTRGGIATIHANSAESALIRVKDLANESGVTVSPHLICESIQVIVAMDFDQQFGRRVKEIKLLRGYKDGQYVFEDLC